MPSLDTNCLLRWLLNDIPEQAALVTSLVNSEENFAVHSAPLNFSLFYVTFTLLAQRMKEKNNDKSCCFITGN